MGRYPGRYRPKTTGWRATTGLRERQATSASWRRSPLPGSRSGTTHLPTRQTVAPSAPVHYSNLLSTARAAPPALANGCAPVPGSGRASADMQQTPAVSDPLRTRWSGLARPAASRRPLINPWLRLPDAALWSWRGGGDRGSPLHVNYHAVMPASHSAAPFVSCVWPWTFAARKGAQAARYS